MVVAPPSVVGTPVPVVGAPSEATPDPVPNKLGSKGANGPAGKSEPDTKVEGASVEVVEASKVDVKGSGRDVGDGDVSVGSALAHIRRRGSNTGSTEGTFLPTEPAKAPLAEEDSGLVEVGDKLLLLGGGGEEDEGGEEDDDKVRGRCEVCFLRA